MARAMKDSGVAWIGKVPQEWIVKRMKDCYISNSRRQPNNTVLSLSYGKVIVKDMDEKKGVTPESYDSYQGVLQGDVILRLTDLQNDQKSLRVGRATTSGIITSAYLCVSSHMIDNRYSAYLLHDVGDIQKVFYGLGGGVRQSMKFADLAELLFPLPMKAEQLTIADYLDRKTALIDQRLNTLAEKKSVLAELRKATIHEAVTKGLHKTAAMKDPGVTWVGAVPSHWTTVRFKNVAKLNPPTVLPKLDEIDFFPMDAIGVDGGLTFGQRKAVSQAGGYSQMQNGDVCFAKVTPCFENGKSAIVEGLEFKVALATTEITVLRPNKKINLNFLHYRIKGIDFAEGGANEMKGAGGLKRVPERFASDFVFQLPPLPEQIAIADHLDQQTQHIDDQLATLDEQAQVLKELRKAIIHEAVTGKIDLSGT